SAAECRDVVQNRCTVTQCHAVGIWDCGNRGIGTVDGDSFVRVVLIFSGIVVDVARVAGIPLIISSHGPYCGSKTCRCGVVAISVDLYSFGINQISVLVQGECDCPRWIISASDCGAVGQCRWRGAKSDVRLIGNCGNRRV